MDGIRSCSFNGQPCVTPSASAACTSRLNARAAHQADSCSIELQKAHRQVVVRQACTHWRLKRVLAIWISEASST